MPKNTKRTITEEQKQILLENPNVEDVGKVSIYYTKAFKERALELYYQGYTPIISSIALLYLILKNLKNNLKNI